MFPTECIPSLVHLSVLRIVPSGWWHQSGFHRYNLQPRATSHAKIRCFISFVPILMWQFLAFHSFTQIAEINFSMTKQLHLPFSSSREIHAAANFGSHSSIPVSVMPYLWSIANFFTVFAVYTFHRSLIQVETNSFQAHSGRQAATHFAGIMAGSTWLRSRSKLSLGPLN